MIPRNNINNQINNNSQKSDGGVDFVDKKKSPFVRSFKNDILKSGVKNAGKIAEKIIPRTKEPVNHIDKVSNANNVAGIPNDTLRKARPKSLIHTYRGDVEQMVKKNKLSVMKMASLEMDKKKKTRRPVFRYQDTNQSDKSTAMLILLFVLVLIGAVSLAGAYYMYVLKNETKPIVSQMYHSLIFTEGVEAVDTTDKMARILKQELTKFRVGKYYSDGSVIEFYLTKQQKMENSDETYPVRLTVSQALNALDLKTLTKTDAVFTGNYIIGIFAMQTGNVPFLVLKTNLFEYAFDAFLKWENYMEQDLAPLFSPGGEYVEPAVLSGHNKFTDTVMKNFSVRVLRDDNGDIRLMYSFINKNTVLLTTDINAFVELTGRLQVAN